MKVHLILIETVHTDPDGPGRLKRLLEQIHDTYNLDAIAVEADRFRARDFDDAYIDFSEIKSEFTSEEIENRIAPMKNEGFNVDTLKELCFGECPVEGFEYFIPKIYWMQKVPIYFIDCIRTDEIYAKELMKNTSIEENAVELLDDIGQVTYKISPQELRQFVASKYSYSTVEENALSYYPDILRKILGNADRTPSKDEEQKAVDEVNQILKNKADHLSHSDEHVEKEIRKLSKYYESIVYVGGLGHILKYPFGNKNLYERIQDLQPVVIRLCDADNLILRSNY